MAKAIWNGVTLAESDDGVLVEGNVYFPRIDIDWGHIQLSDDIEHTYCHWKGMAEYYDVFVGGETNEGAAWSYADPYEAAGESRSGRASRSSTARMARASSRRCPASAATRRDGRRFAGI